jgi:pimeloyl-ACP methyl ester carboxylesterase
MTNTPTPTHLVTLPDGRLLAVDEHGPRGGPVVVFLHAAPGSRVLDPDPAATAAAGVRLITIDRPGYGASTPLAEGVIPSIAGMADDVAAALAAMGVTDAGVVGWSKGGLVALALAARHPDLVRAVALVVTPASDDDVPWLPDEHRQVLRPLRDDPGAARPTLREVFAPFAADVDAAVTTVTSGAADAAALEDPAVRERVAAMVAEAFRPGADGVATDVAAADVLPWGFDPAAVGARTTLHYGDADELVTPAHGEHFARVIAGSTLRVVPGAGHLLPLLDWPAILASVS